MTQGLQHVSLISSIIAFFVFWYIRKEGAIETIQRQDYCAQETKLVAVISRSLCTTLEDSITSGNLTKLSALIYEMLKSFISPHWQR